jgi:hypothetical protein
LPRFGDACWTAINHTVPPDLSIQARSLESADCERF